MEKQPETSQNCSKCRKSFGDAEQLKTHFNSVHGRIQLLKCDICITFFEHWDGLMKHLQSRHSDELKAFQRTQSQKLFTTKNNLVPNGKSVNEKTKPFQCLQCQKMLGSKTILTRHVQAVHEKLKPFQCLHCQKMFSFKPNLTRHVQAVHENLKPFQCPKCQKVFTVRGTLNWHVKHIHAK
jgi:KRAB domain-containing zinc finger protein